MHYWLAGWQCVFVFVCACNDALSSWSYNSVASEGTVVRQGQMKDVDECCRIRAESLSEGRAAEGEQKIAQLRETERQST